MTETYVDSDILAKRIADGVINDGTRLPILGISKASKLNRLKIVEYYQEKKANNSREATLMSRLRILHTFAEFLGNKKFKDLTKKDIIAYTAFMQSPHMSRKRKEPHPLKQSSITIAQMIIRSFMRWVDGEKEVNGKKIYPESVAWIKIKGSTESGVRSEDLFSEEEIQKLIESCRNVRNKAIISTLMESCCRCSEFLGIKIKDLREDDYGYLVTVDGKTNKREIRLVNSVPYIKQWLKYHPSKDNPESNLWVCDGANTRGKPFSPSGLRFVLEQAVKEAGIKNKKIYPHLLRHSNLTLLAGKLTEPYLRKLAGWKGTSKMPATYVHLNSKNLDNVILDKVYNIQTPTLEKLVNDLAPRKCFKCGELYPSDQEYCEECRFPLDPEEIKRKKQDEVSMIERLIEKKIDELLLREHNIVERAKKL